MRIARESRARKIKQDMSSYVPCTMSLVRGPTPRTHTYFFAPNFAIELAIVLTNFISNPWYFRLAGVAISIFNLSVRVAGEDGT